MAKKLIRRADFYALVGQDYPFAFGRKGDGKVAITETFLLHTGGSVTPSPTLLETFEPDDVAEEVVVFPFPFEKLTGMNQNRRNTLINMGIRTFEELVNTDNATLASLFNKTQQWVINKKSQWVTE